jgi:hypothetical protein
VAAYRQFEIALAHLDGEVGQDTPDRESPGTPTAAAGGA